MRIWIRNFQRASAPKFNNLVRCFVLLLKFNCSMASNVFFSKERVTFWIVICIIVSKATFRASCNIENVANYIDRFMSLDWPFLSLSISFFFAHCLSALSMKIWFIYWWYRSSGRRYTEHIAIDMSWICCVCTVYIYWIHICQQHSKNRTQNSMCDSDREKKGDSF